MLAFIPWRRSSAVDDDAWRPFSGGASMREPIEQASVQERSRAVAQAEADRERAHARAIEMLGWMAR